MHSDPHIHISSLDLSSELPYQHFSLEASHLNMSKTELLITFVLPKRLLLEFSPPPYVGTLLFHLLGLKALVSSLIPVSSHTLCSIHQQILPDSPQCISTICPPLTLHCYHLTAIIISCLDHFNRLLTFLLASALASLYCILSTAVRVSLLKYV